MSTITTITYVMPAEFWNELDKTIAEACNTTPPVPFTGKMQEMKDAASDHRLYAALKIERLIRQMKEPRP